MDDFDKGDKGVVKKCWSDGTASRQKLHYIDSIEEKAVISTG